MYIIISKQPSTRHQGKKTFTGSQFELQLLTDNKVAEIRVHDDQGGVVDVITAEVFNKMVISLRDGYFIADYNGCVKD